MPGLRDIGPRRAGPLAARQRAHGTVCINGSARGARAGAGACCTRHLPPRVRDPCPCAPAPRPLRPPVRSFFPATLYLSTSKLAVAVVGNLSFATALCLYNLVIKVPLGPLHSRARGARAQTGLRQQWRSGPRGPSAAMRTASAAACAPAHPGPPQRPRAPSPNASAQVFLGSLREIELERVKEKLSSAIMETCLALTIFRWATRRVANSDGACGRGNGGFSPGPCGIE